jgi:hypothetical protein|tara:strand:+ start:126 stop:407 length:282 start_codon:yes stop_codon:yes gene_type:complete
MKDIFIQSYMDEETQTFLEVGSTLQKDINAMNFTSVPTEFEVSINGTIRINITRKNWAKIVSKWKITFKDAQKELQKQWKDGGRKNLVLFSII